MTSAARDLMDTGTPGPWCADRTRLRDLHFGPMYTTTIHAGNRNLVAVPSLKIADARKACLSVNALALVAALCEALDNYATAVEADRADAWRLVCLAHLALEAALRGEGE